MICPECGGAGRVLRRFLIFWRRERECPNCLGTGEYPPRVAALARRLERNRAVADDDRDPWPTRSVGSRGSSDRDDSFQVGSGGRSGGGGASASWGDAPGDAAPLIVDPFASEPPSAVDAATASDAATESSAAEPSSDTDSGTSY
jgi:hypothetical protein